jgi:hypothetical protein
MHAVENYSGNWTGELRGIDTSHFVFSLEQDGAMVQGKATFETGSGTPEYSIKGVAGAELSLQLRPLTEDDKNKASRGSLEVTAKLQPDGSLAGRWRSPLGLAGTLTARRESAGDSPEPNAPTKAAKQRVSRELNEGQRNDLYLAYRRMIEVVVDALRGSNEDRSDQFRKLHEIITGYDWANLSIPQWFRT